MQRLRDYLLNFQTLVKKSNIKLGASVQTPSFGLVEPSNENAEKFGFGFR